MIVKAQDEAYIKAVITLDDDQKERLLYRMRVNLTRTWVHEKLDSISALALQQENEEEELAEWRERMKKINEVEQR